MNVIPFWGTIKKVPNISFEKWIQERNKKYYGSNSILYKGYTGREATLKDLRTVYGDSLIEGKDVSVYTDEDILFFKRIINVGEKKLDNLSASSYRLKFDNYEDIKKELKIIKRQIDDRIKLKK